MDAISFVSSRYLPYIVRVETHGSELARRAAGHFHKVSVITTGQSASLAHLEDGNLSPSVYRITSFVPHENYHMPSPWSLLQSALDRRALGETDSLVRYCRGENVFIVRIANPKELDDFSMLDPHMIIAD